VVQTADGALNETGAILQRMRDLSVQASNGGSQDADAQKAANTEFLELNKELDRISQTTKFGSQSILGGTYTGTFQVDSGTGAGSTIGVDLTSTGALSGLTITGFSAASLGTSTAGIDLTTTANAVATIDVLDKAIKDVSTVRATLGAYQNRFEHTINNLNVSVENLSASESPSATPTWRRK
jgi:flagellin